MTQQLHVGGKKNKKQRKMKEKYLLNS